MAKAELVAQLAAMKVGEFRSFPVSGTTTLRVTRRTDRGEYKFWFIRPAGTVQVLGGKRFYGDPEVCAHWACEMVG